MSKMSKRMWKMKSKVWTVLSRLDRGTRRIFPLPGKKRHCLDVDKVLRPEPT